AIRNRPVTSRAKRISSRPAVAHSFDRSAWHFDCRVRGAPHEQRHRDSTAGRGDSEGQPTWLAVDHIQDSSALAMTRRTQSMKLFRLVRDCSGQDLAEYAMLISLITLVLIAALTLIGSRLSAMFTAVAGAF